MADDAAGTVSLSLSDLVLVRAAGTVAALALRRPVSPAGAGSAGNRETDCLNVSVEPVICGCM
jgi:hypothetical protein